MKPKILLSIFVVFAVISSTMAWTGAHTVLSVRAFDNMPIAVSVNGVNYGGISNNHELVNLPHGQHRLKVTAITQVPGSWAQERRVIYNGSVTVQAGHHVQTMVQPFNNLSVMGIAALGNQGPQVINGVNTQFTMGHWSQATGQGQVIGTCNTGNWNNNGWNNNNWNNTGWNNWNQPVNQGQGFNNQAWPMQEQEFNALLGVIANRSFDSSRAAIARQAITNNLLTSDQVRRLLNVFSFESTRLELAKHAFNSVVDPERYYIVYDAFQFESSIDQLNRFIYG